MRDIYMDVYLCVCVRGRRRERQRGGEVGESKKYSRILLSAGGGMINSFLKFLCDFLGFFWRWAYFWHWVSVMFPLEKKAVTSFGKKKILVGYVEVQRKQAPEGDSAKGALRGFLAPGDRLASCPDCAALVPSGPPVQPDSKPRLQCEHSVPLTKPLGTSECKAVSPPGRGRSPCGFLKSL